MNYFNSNGSEEPIMNEENREDNAKGLTAGFYPEVE